MAVRAVLQIRGLYRPSLKTRIRSVRAWRSRGVSLNVQHSVATRSYARAQFVFRFCAAPYQLGKKSTTKVLYLKMESDLGKPRPTEAYGTLSLKTRHYDVLSIFWATNHKALLRFSVHVVRRIEVLSYLHLRYNYLNSLPVTVDSFYCSEVFPVYCQVLWSRNR